jgi:hypothetical protein
MAREHKTAKTQRGEKGGGKIRGRALHVEAPNRLENLLRSFMCSVQDEA